MTDTPRLHSAEQLEDARGDSLVLLAPAPFESALPALRLPAPLKQAVSEALAADRALARGEIAPAVLPSASAPGGRVVVAPLGPMDSDTDDARRVAEVAAAAVSRAVQSGARRPVVHLALPNGERFQHAHRAVALAALGAAWSPVSRRDGLRGVTVVGLGRAESRWVEAVESGRGLCRDLVVGGPEELAPPAAAERCREAFRGSGVKVRTEEDLSGYPLLAAVARASQTVRRHRARVQTLELLPEGKVTSTLLLAGKGLTYDTGGADLKTGGSMAGMSRDKGGAATVAGLVLALARLKVPGLRVVAALGWVRNSAGEEAYVSDEILVARSGKRVRIGNTDAEGRLVLADLLCALRERAAKLPSPVLVSVATLTGHAYRAFGPCVAALENAAARRLRFLERLSAAGERLGEPVESTRPRREDYLFVAPKSPAEDVVSSNRLASVDTPRGHQGPFAFLDVASGLEGSGLPFVHLDIAGVVVSPPDWATGRPTGAPVASLVESLAPA